METMPEGGGMAPRPSWWSRNWKWAAPLGCLGLLSCGCLGAFVLGASALSSAVSGGPRSEAIHTAQQDPEVQRALGSPIHAGGLFDSQTNFHESNGQGHARLHIPLDGPKGHGMLDAEAAKEGGQWNFSRLVVEVQGEPPIDLLDSSGGSAPPSEEENAPPPPRPSRPPKAPRGQHAPTPPSPPGAGEQPGEDSDSQKGNDVEL